MILKYKDNWPEIIESAKSQNLDFDNTIILLGLMETNEEGNELYKLEAKGREAKGKADVYAKWIRNKDYHYQNYLKRLSVDEEPFEFLEYAFGANEPLKQYISYITQEFSSKENK